MSSLTLAGIGFICFALGMIVGRMFKTTEMDTDSCVAYLKDKGYVVNLNVPIK